MNDLQANEANEANEFSSKINFHFEELFNSINEKNTKDISNKVDQLLTIIFVENNLTTTVEKNNYIKDIYKLIFYFQPKNINISTSIICGFIQFGKKKSWKNYRPMIDYFLMESFDILLKQCGWCIIKPIMNMLHNNIYNFQTETLFSYVSSKIIRQLIEDIVIMNEIKTNKNNNDNDNIKNNINTDSSISELCYHVPREKSFSFGWYSYYIACELYENKNYYKKQLKQTQIRHYLMNYRKIINELRNNSILEIGNYSEEEDEIDIYLNYVTVEEELKTDKYNYIDKIVDFILDSPKKEIKVQPLTLVKKDKKE